jgi:hypothetical protein
VPQPQRPMDTSNIAHLMASYPHAYLAISLRY